MKPALTNELQLDALREVANIGCGHAANALSKLVGGRVVSVDVPRVWMASEADLRGQLAGSGPLVASAFDIEGELTGRLVLLWDEPDARVLTQLLLPDAPARGSLLEEPRLSALSEAANILASACLSAIGQLTRLRILPSTPEVTLAPATQLLPRLFGSGELSKEAVVMQTRFITAGAAPMTGRLLLISNVTSLPRLFGALGI